MNKNHQIIFKDCTVELDKDLEVVKIEGDGVEPAPELIFKIVGLARAAVETALVELISVFEKGDIERLQGLPEQEGTRLLPEKNIQTDVETSVFIVKDGKEDTESGIAFKQTKKSDVSAEDLIAALEESRWIIKYEVFRFKIVFPNSGLEDANLMDSDSLELSAPN